MSTDLTDSDRAHPLSAHLLDATIAALRALPPETVADVRACAALARAFEHTSLDPVEHERHRDRADRLTALVSLLDAVREVARG